MNTDQKKKMQVLANELTRANTNFLFGKTLLKNYRQLGSAKDFWDYTLTAHFSIALLNLCRVYDFHKDGINLVNCLKSIDQKCLNHALRNQLNVYITECSSKSQNPLVKSLRTWRNNIVAHYNLKAALDRADFDKNYPDEPEQMLNKLIPHGFEILEWCSQICGEVIAYEKFAPGKDGCEMVLQRLRKIE